MDFIASAVVGGIIYDLLKAGVTKLTVGDLMEGFYCANVDESRCQNFIDEVNEVKDSTQKERYIQTILNTENVYTTMFETELYKTNFAKRLDYALTMINNTDYFTKKINVESLGEFLGFDSVNTLKKYYITDEEPEYRFITMVAEKLGINPAWLKSGEGNIFESKLPRLHRGTELFNEKDYSEVSEYIFAMLDVPYERQLVVIKRINDIKYEYYSRPFIFYCSGGGEGASELLSVYQMLQRLNKEKLMPSEVYCLEEKDFYNLLQGKMYPGSVKKAERKGYLLDDFISISKEKAEEYLNWYGESFVDAQNCILQEEKYLDMIKEES